MKINVIGIKRIKGAKSKAGNPFDICSIFGLVLIEATDNEKLTITGKGYEIAEIPFDPNEFDMVAFSSNKFPQLIELHMDSRPRYGKFEAICIGFEPPKA